MNFTQSLCELVKDANVKFVFEGKPISSEEVFADTGLLPALARRADQLCLLCFGYGIGLSFVDADKSLLGTKVQFDEVTPNVLRLACLYDAILEIADASSTKDSVSLDELMYD